MIRYQDAGVDQKKAAGILSDFAKFQRSRPRDPNILTGIGPFASCYSLLPKISAMEEPCLATSCDGVGTKCLLALNWNDLSGLGQDLVAMNVNDLLCVGARPLLFLDYYACGSLNAHQLTRLLKSIQGGCEIAGCSLVGGETAEMPGLYLGEEFDLAGFAVGLVDKKHMLGAHRVEEGAVLIALESSGFHSNGFSLVRKLVENEKIDPKKPAPGTPKTWQEALLAPTQIYAKALGPVMDVLWAAAHLTGGVLFENLVRVIPQGLRAVVESQRWHVPPLFQWAGKSAGLSMKELLSTFNCGVGMILIASADHTSLITKAMEKNGVKAWEVGIVERSLSRAPDVRWV